MKRLETFFRQFVLISMLIGFGSGCELIATVDRSQIPGAGGAGPSTGGGGSGAEGGQGGGGQGGGGQGGGVECTTNDECGTDTECQTFTCNRDGECVTNNLPTTTNCGVAGTECKVQDTCDGNGACTDNGFEPNTHECRPSAGECDAAELCDGTTDTCPVDAFEANTVACTGASQGATCDDDANDRCSGTANTCVDAFEANTVECRADAGACDVAESCTGTSGACPADAFEANTVTCTGTSQGDDCDDDGNDHCSGTANTCVDAFEANTVECRADAGACDVADNCTGSSGACPADAFEPNTVTCTGTSQGDDCDDDGNDHCSGTANTCVDAFEANTVVCRADAGACDVADNCTGSSGACPADAFEPNTVTCTGTSQGDDCDDDANDHCSGTANTCVDVFDGNGVVCRPDAGQCDAGAESCTGGSGACPADSFEPNTTPCTGTSQAAFCDNDAGDRCSGTSNTCVDAFDPDTLECRADTGQCDVAEKCTGSSGTCPVDGFEAVTVTCTGTSQGDDCDDDASDHCLGSAATCVDAFEANTVECRGDTGACDVAENCTGSSGACPGDAFEPNTTLCTGASQGDLCDDDVSDHCLGGADTCVDVFDGNGVVCRPDAGQCDVGAENCTGSSGACPADSFEPNTTPCTGTSQGGFCDDNAGDRCSGTSNTCVDAFDPDTLECRPDAGQCDVAENCTGTSGTCPVDGFEPATTACDDGNSCTSGSECDGGGVCETTVVDDCEVLWCFETAPSTYTPNPTLGTGTLSLGTGLTSETHPSGNTDAMPAACTVTTGNLAISATGWQTSTSFAQALTNDDCFTFTLDTGADPLFLRFDNDASGTGPTHYGVQVEVDGVTQTVLVDDPVDQTFTSHPMTEIDLSGLGLDGQIDAIVRICGYRLLGGGSATGTWRLDNVHILSNPTCTDGDQNGSETDVDCGGPDCGPCAFGEKCLVNSDCDEPASFLCDPEAAATSGGDARCNCDVGADTCLVTSGLPDGTGFDIQAALSTVAAGGQVLVPFAIYTPVNLSLANPVSLSPATLNSGVWARDLTGPAPIIQTAATSPLASVQISAANVTVEGFHLIFRTQSCIDSVEGVVLDGAANGAHVTNNVFFVGGGAGSIGFQTLTTATSLSGLVIDFNQFQNDGSSPPCSPNGTETDVPIPGHYEAIVIRTETPVASGPVFIINNTIVGKVSRAISIHRAFTNIVSNNLSAAGATLIPAAELPTAIEIGVLASAGIQVMSNRIGSFGGFETGLDVLAPASALVGPVSNNCFHSNNTAIQYPGPGVLSAIGNNWVPDDGTGEPGDCGGSSANNCADSQATIDTSNPLLSCPLP